VEPATSIISWDPIRRELVAWFRANAAPLACGYEGAVRLLDDPAFPGRVHFIAHAVRDIVDRLPYVLDPQPASSRVQYENRMDQIAKLWSSLQPLDASRDDSKRNSEVTIELKVAKLIDSFVLEHLGRPRRRSNHELLFKILMRKEPSQAAVSQLLLSEFEDVRQWFMAFAHLPATKPREVSHEELCSQFTKLEGMLHSFVGDFFTGTAPIDEILRQANE
jgi:hypothetical protein